MPCPGCPWDPPSLSPPSMNPHTGRQQGPTTLDPSCAQATMNTACRGWPDEEGSGAAPVDTLAEVYPALGPLGGGHQSSRTREDCRIGEVSTLRPRPPPGREGGSSGEVAIRPTSCL